MTDKFNFSMTPVEVPMLETKHRRVVTKLPVPESLPLLETIARYESSNVKDFPPIIWGSASDYNIEDAWGNRWIDMTSTIFVANAGHANPQVKARIQEVMDKPLLHSYCYPTQERAAYLQKLAAFVPPYLEKFSLYSAGTEATERALKLMRLYGRSISRDKRVIVTGEGNYHGKTLGAQMLCGNPAEKTWICHHDPEIVHLPFPYPWVLEQRGISGRELFHEHLQGLEERGIALTNIAGFMIESFQGWGAIFYPGDYVQAMAEYARENRSLLTVDEIQAGFGRTGKLFGYQHYGVEPDIVCAGKAVSSSMPLSVVMARGEIIDLDPVYTSTHGGHPMACAAGLGTLEAFEQLDLINEAQRKEHYFNEALARLRQRFPKHIPLTMGRGMVHAIYVADPQAGAEKNVRQRLDPVLTDRIVEKAMHKGVFLVRTGCGTLKLGPPLTLPDDALVEALEVVEESIAECL